MNLNKLYERCGEGMRRREEEEECKKMVLSQEAGGPRGCSEEGRRRSDDQRTEDDEMVEVGAELLESSRVHLFVSSLAFFNF